MFGSIPEWVSALAAVAALMAAAYAAHISKQLFTIESGRDEISATRREREHASQVAAWCVACPKPGDEHRHGILVHNSSTSPVFDVEITSTYAPRASAPAEAQPPLALTVLPPGDYVALRDPQFRWTFPEERATLDGPARPITKNAAWVVQQITFTDAQGQRWCRSGGQLTAVQPAEAFAPAPEAAAVAAA